MRLWFLIMMMFVLPLPTVAQKGDLPRKGYVDQPEISDAQLHVLMDEPVSLGYNDQHTKGLDLYRSADKSTAHVTTCRQYLDRRNEGYGPRTTFGITMESFFVSKCYPLYFLEHSKTAEKSAFRAPVFSDEELGTLPASMGEILAITRHKICGEARNLKDCLDDHVVDADSARIEVSSTKIAIEDDGQSAGYEIIASGDFNQDGWQDLYVDFHYFIKGATYRSYGGFCLEKPGKDEATRVLDCFNDLRLD